MDKHNLLQHKDIHKYEFEVYANLNFSLLIDFEETEQDFLYTLQRMDISPVEYIGDFINDSDFFNKLSY